MKKLNLILLFSIIVCQFSPANASVYSLYMPSDTTPQQADSLSKAINSKAYDEYIKGNYSAAEQLYTRVAWLKEKYSPDDSVKLVIAYASCASVLITVWKNEIAMQYIDKALRISNPKDLSSYLGLLLRMAYVQYYLGDSYSALTTSDKIIRELKKNPNSNNIELLFRILLLKNTLLINKGDIKGSALIIDSMENFIGKIPKTLERTLYFSIYNNLIKLKKYNEALQFFNKSINTNSRFKQENDIVFAFFLYTHLQEYDKAIEAYKKILEDGAQTISDIFLLEIYNNLGNCYEQKGMYKEALTEYQNALFHMYPDFTDPDFRTSPPQERVYFEAQNLTLFKNKAEVLRKYAYASKDRSFLEAAFENSLRAVDIVQKMRDRVTSQQSQFLISKDEHSAYTFAQYVGVERYLQTGDNSYLNKAFEVNEKGKAFSLLAAMRSQRAMEFAGLPEEIRKQENDLNRQLSLYDELLYKEKQKSHPDNNLIQTWEDQLFTANTQYKDLLMKLERDYPEYYRLKYDEKVTSIADIQNKIDFNTSLVEYTLMDTVLIIYTASKNRSDAKIVKLEPGFQDKCIAFLNLINTQSFSDSVTKTYNTYTKMAWDLYSVVIAPVKDQLIGENIIVIPDGAISYLPFDALLSARVPEGKPDYRHIPYLIRDYSFGYSYSTTIHFNPIQHVKVPNSDVLAFAPIYSSALANAKKPADEDEAIYLDLPSLPGVAMEVNNISHILKTDAYYNVSAKESIFKQKAGKYNILHLAMHTMVDNTDPMLSRLIFTQVPDGKEDGLLYTYEIYNLKLNAKLTVLSSCSSGYGKIQPGEGVQSLARGFAYAGCPSVLMTLWEVGDLSAVLLMTDFYHFLGKHQTKPQALRNSKLDFLEQADDLRSNPFFWASYVVIGDSSPIYPFKVDMAALNAFLLLLPLGFLGIYYRKYRKELKKSRD